MREILYRGKRLDNGEWVQGTYYKQTMFYGTPQEKHFIITSTETLGDDGALEYFEVDPATVGQCSGMEDKNAKPIFEDDVVIPTVNDGIYQGYSWGKQKVVFDCGAFCVEDRYRQTLPLKRFSPRVEIEVIGNIHDNPELLEGGGAREE